MWILWIFLTAASAVSFALFGADKRRAVRREWRIPEKTLFLAALCGGAPGALLGMAIFRHKTRKPGFRYGIPVLVLLEGAAVFLLVSAGVFQNV